MHAMHVRHECELLSEGFVEGSGDGSMHGRGAL